MFFKKKRTEIHAGNGHGYHIRIGDTSTGEVRLDGDYRAIMFAVGGPIGKTAGKNRDCVSAIVCCADTLEVTQTVAAGLVAIDDFLGRHPDVGAVLKEVTEMMEKEERGDL